MIKISKWAKNKWGVLGLFEYILPQDIYVLEVKEMKDEVCFCNNYFTLKDDGTNRKVPYFKWS